MKTSKHRPQKRTLGLESLESRELLSVAPLTYPVDSTVEYRESDWFEQVSERPALLPTSEGVIGNEWIIQLKDNVLPKISSVKMAAEYLDDYGVTVIGGLGAIGTLLVCIEEGTPAQQNDILSGVDYIDAWEQNYISVNSSIADVFDDPQATNQWYLDTLNILPAWEQTTGDGVVVAVIDSGIQLDNPDLQENIWTNPGEIAGNGMDDDGNGFVDDVHGWNTTYLNSNDVADTFSHGTQVSSVLGAVGNNSHGTVGVSPNAKILPVKAGSSVFGSSDVISGINYAIKLKTEHSVNINVINISIGIATHEIYNASLDAAGKADILVVIGAGNNAEDNDQAKSYPNQFDNVIVVAATDQNDTLSWFSSYGNTSVDLTAPGERIWIPSHTIGQGSYFGYTYGTSFSAPMVSGAAALLASAHPDWTAAQIKEAILATVDVLPSLEGKVASGGRLNIGNAINYNPTANSTAPEAPSDLSVVKMSNGILQLKWADNSRNESSFVLQYSSDNGNTWNTIDSRIPKNATSTAYTPTQTGTFQFRIRSSNNYGNSAWSPVATIQMDSLPIPGTPTGLNAVAVGENLGIRLTWNSVSNVTSYRVERSLTGSDWTEIHEGTQTSFTDTDIEMSTRYFYRVIAINGQSASVPSNSVYVTAPIMKPETPTGLTFEDITSTSIRLIWDKVQYATEYTVLRRENMEWDWTTIATTTTASFTDYDVKPSTSYSYKIIAGNGVRQSDESNFSACVTPALTPPDGPPHSVFAVAESDKIVNLSWEAVPGATSYIIERSTDGTTWRKIATVTNATTYQNKSLTALTTYHYRVSSSGLSVTTEASDIVTVKTKLASSVVPTIKVDSKQIGITDVGTISIVPTRTTPSRGLSYFIEYTCAVDAKRKPDWSQSITEKVTGTTHRFQTTLHAGTQYYARIVAMESDIIVTDSIAVNIGSGMVVGKEAKFKTKSAPLAKITTSGFAMSGGEFGVKLRITNPQQNDNARNPLLPDGTSFSYQLIVADDKAKADKVTGILATGTFAPLSLGNVTFTETMVKNKKYFDSPVILFQDIAKLGDMTKLKSVQFQLLVTYTMPDGVVTTAASKATKLTLPKWFV